jgi:hypothetical protein
MGKRFKASSQKDEWHGEPLKTILEESQSKLENLQPQPYLLGDPEDLIHIDWFGDSRERGRQPPANPGTARSPTRIIRSIPCITISRCGS